MHPLQNTFCTSCNPRWNRLYHFLVNFTNQASAVSTPCSRRAKGFTVLANIVAEDSTHGQVLSVPVLCVWITALLFTRHRAPSVLVVPSQTALFWQASIVLEQIVFFGSTLSWGQVMLGAIAIFRSITTSTSNRTEQRAFGLGKKKWTIGVESLALLAQNRQHIKMEMANRAKKNQDLSKSCLRV